MSYFNKLVFYFLPFSHVKSAEISRKPRLLISFIILTFAILAVFTPSHIISHKHFSTLINFAGIISLIISLFFYKYTANYNLTSLFYFVLVAALINANHLIGPNQLAINYLWIPIVLIGANYLLNSFAGTIYTVLFSSCFAISNFLKNENLFVGDTFTDNELLQMSTISIILVSAISILIIKQIMKEEKNKNSYVIKKNKKLLELNEDNNALLSIISHDIANSLMVIQSATNVLGHSHKMDSSKEKYYERINRHILQIENIIKQVRELKAGNTGKLQLAIVPVDLNDAIEQSISTFSHRLEQKNIIINKNIKDQNNSPLIMAEPISLINSVLNNLLSNAIKFSELNSIVDIGVSRRENHIIEFRIRDYGMGMPKEILENIFSSSKPTHTKGTMGENGTGFGMPICKMFVEKYNANIRVQSFTEATKTNHRGTEIKIDFNEFIEKEITNTNENESANNSKDKILNNKIA